MCRVADADSLVRVQVKPPWTYNKGYVRYTEAGVVPRLASAILTRRCINMRWPSGGVAATITVVAVLSFGLVPGMGVARAADEVDFTKMSSGAVYEHALMLDATGDRAAAIKAWRYIVANSEAEAYVPMAHYAIAAILYWGKAAAEPRRAHLEVIQEHYPDSPIWCHGAAPVLLVRTVGLREQRFEEARQIATQVLDEYGDVMDPRHRMLLIYRIGESYSRRRLYAEATDYLAEQLPDCPLLLNELMYHQLVVKAYLALGDPGEALSYARAAYVLCNYDDTEIEFGAELVRDAYLAMGEPEQATAFFASQEDPDVANPLQEKPLPEVSEGELARMLQAADGDPATLAGIYLYVGDNAAALAAATTCLAETLPEMRTAAIRQVARVLKGVDLDLFRANEYIRRAKTGATSLQVLELQSVTTGRRIPTTVEPFNTTGRRDGARCLALIAREHTVPDDFVEWVRANDISLQALDQAAMIHQPLLKWMRYDETNQALGPALLEAVGEGLGKAGELGLAGRLVLALHLGMLDREEDVKTIMASVLEADRVFQSQVPYYLLATSLYYERKSLRAAIWCWEQGSPYAGPADVALVSWTNANAALRLAETDPDAARTEFRRVIAWAEEALATPGSEPMWDHAFYALARCYASLGEPQAGVERCKYWLQQAEARVVPSDTLAICKLRLARALTSSGDVLAAAKVLHELIEEQVSWTGRAARAELERLIEAHPDAEIEPPKAHEEAK